LPPEPTLVPVGETLPTLTKAITREKIEAFEVMGQALRTGGLDRALPENIHTTEAIAQSRGLERPVASGQMSFAYLHELLARRFGIDFRQGGHLSVTFLRPVYAGDLLTSHGVVISSEMVEGRNRLVVQVWLENQRAERTATGEAEVTIPSPLT
jgi:acyl dehydratase